MLHSTINAARRTEVPVDAVTLGATLDPRCSSYFLDLAVRLVEGDAVAQVLEHLQRRLPRAAARVRRAMGADLGDAVSAGGLARFLMGMAMGAQAGAVASAQAA